MKISKEITFVTSVFGDRYFGMLVPLLFSIKKTHPKSRVVILWEGIKKWRMDVLINSYKEYKFIETDFNFDRDLSKRIASKMLMWELASKIVKNGKTLFIDSDILMVKSVNKMLSDVTVDVVFTVNQKKFPVNSGVVFCNLNDNVRLFFEKWRNRTMEIINDPDLFAVANDMSMPYGAADQMALIELIGYSRDNGWKYKVKVGLSELRFKAVSCEVLNEVESKTIGPKTHIIHYKGGWRAILAGERFTKNRPKEDCWEMYIHYLITSQESLEYLREKVGCNWSLRDLGLKWPIYIDSYGREISGIYDLMLPWIVMLEYKRKILNMIKNRNINT